MLIYEAISKHAKGIEVSWTIRNENVDMIISQITEFKKHNISIQKCLKSKKMKHLILI